MNSTLKKFLRIEKIETVLSRIIKEELLLSHQNVIAENDKLRADFFQMVGKLDSLSDEFRILEEKLDRTQQELEKERRRREEAEVENLKNVSSQISSHVSSQVQRLENSLSCLFQRVSVPAERKRIVFLIHNVAAIDAILPIIYEAQRREHRVVVIAIRNKFSSSQTNVESQHIALQSLGIEHLRFEKLNPGEGLDYLKSIYPDVIFRQSPWERDIDEEFSIERLRFSKVCYAPYYGIQFLRHFTPEDPVDYHCDQEFHRKAWAIFVEDATEVFDNFKNSSLMRGINIVPTGLPKYEHLTGQLSASSRPEKNIKTILWAPHHSFDKNWLGFATFIETHNEILKFLEENKDTFNIIFRPHPLFKTNLVSSGKMTNEQYESVMNRFKELPNFSFSTHSSPHYDFDASDLLLTDGISFLASYLVTHKPIVWLDSNHHMEFTTLGAKVASGSYRLSIENLPSLQTVIRTILVDGKDPLFEEREKLRKILLGKGRPSENILNYIEQNV